MTTYNFRASSIVGLTVSVTVLAKNYVEAKRKVLKHIYLHTESALFNRFPEHNMWGE